jgi:hypothetical protein
MGTSAALLAAVELAQLATHVTTAVAQKGEISDADWTHLRARLDQAEANWRAATTKTVG